MLKNKNSVHSSIIFWSPFIALLIGGMLLLFSLLFATFYLIPWQNYHAELIRYYPKAEEKQVIALTKISLYRNIVFFAFIFGTILSLGPLMYSFIIYLIKSDPEKYPLKVETHPFDKISSNFVINDKEIHNLNSNALFVENKQLTWCELCGVKYDKDQIFCNNCGEINNTRKFLTNKI